MYVLDDSMSPCLRLPVDSLLAISMRASFTVPPTKPSDVRLIRTGVITAHSFRTHDRLALGALEVLPTHAALTDGQSAANRLTDFKRLFSPVFGAYLSEENMRMECLERLTDGCKRHAPPSVEPATCTPPLCIACASVRDKDASSTRPS